MCYVKSCAAQCDIATLSLSESPVILKYTILNPSRENNVLKDTKAVAQFGTISLHQIMLEARQQLKH